jgi:hypothetical protein
MQAKGGRVLTEGLSAFPAEFTPSTTTPLAYWKTESFGFVVFLAGSPNVEKHPDLSLWTVQYHLSNGEWIPHGPTGGRLGLPDETEDKAVRWAIRWAGRVTSGPEDEGPALIVWGWCSNRVARLSLIQNEESISIPVGHLGSWVVGSERGDPWRVEASDGAGNTLGFISQDWWW